MTLLIISLNRTTAHVSHDEVPVFSSLGAAGKAPQHQLFSADSDGCCKINPLHFCV